MSTGTAQVSIIYPYHHVPFPSCFIHQFKKEKIYISSYWTRVSTKSAAYIFIGKWSQWWIYKYLISPSITNNIKNNWIEFE